MFGLKAQDKKDDERDLGFGSVVASRTSARLLNRDGTFNTKRKGLGPLASLHLYDALLTMRWSSFLLLVAAAYLLVNSVFAVVYVALGPEALSGPAATTFGEHLLRAFFFSVHTLSTIGYGHITARTLTANVVTTVESVFGLIGIALTTGLVFSRFSRPTAKILFSKNALIAPYRGGRGLMFRIANQRSTQIIELEAQAVFSRMEQEDGRRVRRFYRLPLERNKVVFFPLAWTIVHPIDKKSPFTDVTKADCIGAEAEILILLKGTDETFSEVVHTRSSYKAEELVWNAKFTDIYVRNDTDDIVGIDLGELSSYERLPSPEGSS